MEKEATIVYGGINSKVGDFLVNRLLPGRKIEAVGPFVFLDHLYPVELKSDASSIPNGDAAHPHRGIATFSYVFNGSLTHYDSKGHHDTISSGGVQWMKAGNGIIHDEQPFVTEMSGKLFHSLQFWINLPSEVKAEEPEYMAVQSEKIPELELPDNAGKLRILLGAFGSLSSPVRNFNREFIYHIKLNPRSSFSMTGRNGLKYAAFVPTNEVLVNETLAGKSKIVIFDEAVPEMVFENPNIMIADILIFGGQVYTEPIVSQGPFVMNSRAEIAEAYRDFFDGKYGTINYSKR